MREKLSETYVVVYVTASADGKIASRSGDSRLSCPYDLRRLHTIRALSDAVVVGANTVIRDNPSLTVRYVSGENPARVVIDGLLRAPLNSKLFTDGEARTIVYTSRLAPRSKVKALKGLGVEVYQLRSLNNSGRLSVRDVLEHMASMGLRRILVEGGADLLWSFFSEGAVDEFRITISPFIVGGREAIPVVGGVGFTSRDTWVRLKLKDIVRCECGNEVHLIYRIINRNSP